MVSICFYTGLKVTNSLHHHDIFNSGDILEISNPEGKFDRQKLLDASQIIMFAAGTGFTPMAALIHHALYVHDNPER